MTPRTQCPLLPAIAMATALLAALVLAPPAAADEQKRQMTMTGEGAVMAEPDEAELALGVVTEAGTAARALERNSEAMRAAIAALAARGIPENDMQTSAFSVQPRYEYDEKNGRRTRELVGYAVSNRLTVTVRDLDALGALLDEAVGAGANDIRGIRFALSDIARLRDEARRRATAEAIRKAELYAREAGVRLIAITSIAERAGRRPGPVFRSAPMAAKAEAVPVAPGEQRVKIEVDITWEID